MLRIRKEEKREKPTVQSVSEEKYECEHCEKIIENIEKKFHMKTFHSVRLRRKDQ